MSAVGGAASFCCPPRALFRDPLFLPLNTSPASDFALWASLELVCFAIGLSLNFVFVLVARNRFLLFLKTRRKIWRDIPTLDNFFSL
jgi:hypothetical protein